MSRVEFAANLKASGALRDMAIAALPVTGLDTQASRPHVGGGTVELRITRSPVGAGSAFPAGTYMAAVVESWLSGHLEFLWIGTRGYKTPTAATAAALPQYEDIMRLRGA